MNRCFLNGRASIAGLYLVHEYVHVVEYEGRGIEYLGDWKWRAFALAEGVDYHNADESASYLLTEWDRYFRNDERPWEIWHRPGQSPSGGPGVIRRRTVGSVWVLAGGYVMRSRGWFTAAGATILLLFGVYLAFGAVAGIAFEGGRLGLIRLGGLDVPGGTLTVAVTAVIVFTALGLIVVGVRSANKAAAVIAALLGAAFLVVAVSPSPVAPRDELISLASPILGLLAAVLFLLGDKNSGSQRPMGR